LELFIEGNIKSIIDEAQSLVGTKGQIPPDLLANG
jgi:hypothetical protein